jgi:hypothetical protein
MSRLKKAALLIIWLIFATCLYAYVWSHNLDNFPQFPEAFGRWVSKITGMDHSEDVETLTVYYMLIASFLIVSVFTFIAIFGWTQIRKLIHRSIT